METRKLKVTLGVLAVYIAASGPMAHAWKSAPLMAHTNIMSAALDRVDKAQYPDLADFEVKLLEGANDESWHTVDSLNGGKPEDIWRGVRTDTGGGVLGNYAAFDLEHGYRRIGSICHLTADQAVPTHAANIKHGLFDLFETATGDYSGTLNIVSSDAGSKEPYTYYQATQDDTRRQLSSWVNPKNNRPYWVEDPDSGIKPGEDSTFGVFGSYGAGEDSFAVTHSNARIQAIVDGQFQSAALATYNVIISASKRLPPLVSDLAAANNGGSIAITFNAGDNRSDKVTYQAEVYQNTQLLGSIATGEVRLGRPGAYGLTLGGKAALVWDGTVQGRKLPAGNYTVQVKLTDTDNNTTPDSVNTDKSPVNGTRVDVSLN